MTLRSKKHNLTSHTLNVFYYLVRRKIIVSRREKKTRFRKSETTTFRFKLVQIKGGQSMNNNLKQNKY
jgi:hypothetical protein